MIASGNQSKSEETKSAILLHIVALEIYNTFAWESAGDDKKVYKIMEKFEQSPEKHNMGEARIQHQMSTIRRTNRPVRHRPV